MKRTRSALVACCALLAMFGLPTQAGSSERSFQARLGGFLFEGESDFWDENASVFALEASDFDDTTLGLTYSVPFNRFFEVDLNADLFDETVVSEYRDFTDASGFAILHDSTLQMVPLTLGVRFVPFGRGKHGGKRPVLYVGAGAGVNFWRYEEFGDFIDFNDPANPIIFGEFKERGEAFVGYGVCGLELPLAPGFNLGFEARYFSSYDEFKDDFAVLGTLDISGLAASVSASWRF